MGISDSTCTVCHGATLLTAYRRRCKHSMLAASLFATMVATAVGDGPRFLFGSPTQLEGVNTPSFGEGSPSISTDELELFYTRSKAEGSDDVADIYRAVRDSRDESFKNPSPVAEVNSDLGEGQSTLSSDGLTLYFLKQTSEEEGEPTEIYSATRPSVDEPFGKPELQFASPDGRDAFFAPSISSDGLSFYVQYGHYKGVDNYDSDIYVATRNSVSDAWGDFEPIPGLDGSDYFGRPSISSDDRTLFFKNFKRSSNRDKDQSTGDLYMRTRTSPDASWSSPVNLGSAINTADFDENFANLSSDQQTLYFSRVVDGFDWTKWDLYQAPVLPFEAVEVNGNGTYEQDFDSLGTDDEAGVAFPKGWTFTGNDVVFNNVTTGDYGADSEHFAQSYNAGEFLDRDRTLAIDTMHRLDQGELNLRTTIAESVAGAVQIKFDIEAWQVQQRNRDGEFQVILEADTGEGFQQIADLGSFATEKLEFPEFGAFTTDGNDSAFRSSHDTGLVALNVPAGATMRTRWIAGHSSRGVVFGLDNVSLQFYKPGDTNLDGGVDFGDFLTLSDNFGGQGGWAEGNLNGDEVIDFADFLILADNFGTTPAASPVPEPSSIAMLGVLGLLVGKFRRKR